MHPTISVRTLWTRTLSSCRHLCVTELTASGIVEALQQRRISALASRRCAGERIEGISECIGCGKAGSIVVHLQLRQELCRRHQGINLERPR